MIQLIIGLTLVLAMVASCIAAFVTSEWRLIVVTILCALVLRGR